MNAIHAALAFATASYAKREENQPIASNNQPKATKMVSSKSNQPSSVRSATTHQAKGTTMTHLASQAITMNAKDFLVSMRRAKDRQEKIQAIQSYIGFNTAEDFGTQEMLATMKAKKELNPIKDLSPSREEKRYAARSAMGFVQGMPNNSKKQALDLLAREQLTTESMIQHVKDSRSANGSALQSHHAGQAALEKARLNQIQTDIRNLIG